MNNCILKSFTTLAVIVSLVSCNKDKDSDGLMLTKTITIENVLDSKPLVESGTFEGLEDKPLIFPGQSVSFSFYAAKNQTLTFATMYGLSNDLFFAPGNPGISLYDTNGNPIEGDVSSQIKLWDNGTRVNQIPGLNVSHPGTAETTIKNISEVNGSDEYGNTYLKASQLFGASLKYDGNSKFTFTIKNNSGGTANETPFSPGIWAISYVAGADQLLPNAIYTAGKKSVNGLTKIAESGDNSEISAYLSNQTGIFTPLSPILVVVYEGSENPFYKTGENDRGKGLKELAQQGNATILASNLKKERGVKNVYVLKEPTSTVLLPKVNGSAGGKVTQQLSVSEGDKIAIATMYGFSNDWFFATTGNDIRATEKGNVSNIGLFDNGTAVDQYPGAGITQFNLAGTPLKESKPIQAVPDPNAFNKLPVVSKIIKVTLQ